MSGSNYVTKIAFIGAGGRSGGFMVDALLKTGMHTITALTREDSTSTVPKGVLTAKIDYANQESLINALRGQDALIITMSTAAPKEQEQALIRAAGEAGVQFVLPNEWGPDTANEEIRKDVGLFQVRADNRKLVEELGKTSYISVSTGFWYEWSLAIADSYGFDLNNKSVTLFDDGEAKISTTTWPQVGRAVASLLSLPIKPEGGGDSKKCLENFRNKMVYISSFTVSQKDMLESVLRVTGSKQEEWKITNQPSAERFATGARELQKGNRVGFVHMMYSRIFFPDGCGDVESSKGTSNDLLGLPREDIDDATRVAIERAKTNPWS
ncbi:related to oxidoreductase CipA-like [Ramularia collo-cygni]|uniref:Related to oxidoreductase CipA-like n=1 Tax=Ramularia collo-cygni TaxID=112498 RepID=A0A2D3VEA7_9PEZI|nr:related to oxidoreductase CipA-like [Ramularia collo-cygni]CZT22196.1 related to oxidoreductase CipA-like [Ramularia collo-cygni]